MAPRSGAGNGRREFPWWAGPQRLFFLMRKLPKVCGAAFFVAFVAAFFFVGGHVCLGPCLNSGHRAVRLGPREFQHVTGPTDKAGLGESESERQLSQPGLMPGVCSRSRECRKATQAHGF